MNNIHPRFDRAVDHLLSESERTVPHTIVERGGNQWWVYNAADIAVGRITTQPINSQYPTGGYVADRVVFMAAGASRG